VLIENLLVNTLCSLHPYDHTNVQNYLIMFCMFVFVPEALVDDDDDDFRPSIASPKRPTSSSSSSSSLLAGEYKTERSAVDQSELTVSPSVCIILPPIDPMFAPVDRDKTDSYITKLK
jgi:hypothetical protein